MTQKTRRQPGKILPGDFVIFKLRRESKSLRLAKDKWHHGKVLEVSPSGVTVSCEGIGYLTIFHKYPRMEWAGMDHLFRQAIIIRHVASCVA